MMEWPTRGMKEQMKMSFLRSMSVSIWLLMAEVITSLKGTYLLR